MQRTDYDFDVIGGPSTPPPVRPPEPRPTGTQPGAGPVAGSLDRAAPRPESQPR